MLMEATSEVNQVKSSNENPREIEKLRSKHINQENIVTGIQFVIMHKPLKSVLAAEKHGPMPVENRCVQRTANLAINARKIIILQNYAEQKFQ